VKQFNATDVTIEGPNYLAYMVGLLILLVVGLLLYISYSKKKQKKQQKIRLCTGSICISYIVNFSFWKNHRPIYDSNTKVEACITLTMTSFL